MVCSSRLHWRRLHLWAVEGSLRRREGGGRELKMALVPGPRMMAWYGELGTSAAKLFSDMYLLTEEPDLDRY